MKQESNETVHSIEDFLPLVNTNSIVEFEASKNTWIEAKVVGINFADDTICVIPLTYDNGNDKFNARFVPIYFQLNKKFPKYPKVKIINKTS